MALGVGREHEPREWAWRARGSAGRVSSRRVVAPRRSCGATTEQARSCERCSRGHSPEAARPGALPRHISRSSRRDGTSPASRCKKNHASALAAIRRRLDRDFPCEVSRSPSRRDDCAPLPRNSQPAAPSSIRRRLRSARMVGAVMADSDFLPALIAKRRGKARRAHKLAAARPSGPPDDSRSYRRDFAAAAWW